MKKNAMRRNLRQSILKSLGRYIAIVAIIALGSSMFVGLLMTKSDMVATGQQYMDEQNMFDLRLISTYGWDVQQVDQIAQLEGIVDTEGLVYLDAIAYMEDMQDESVFRFYAIPDRINRISLRGGRMPVNPDECLVDGYHVSEDILGTTVKIAENNLEQTLETFVYREYTVVGYVATPLYMDMNRGTTSVGSGSLQTYIYIPREGFDIDYFPEVNVTIEGDYDVYTDLYNNAMERAADALEPSLKVLGQERFDRIREEAVEAYRDGLKEYSEGLWKYWEGKQEAEQELAEAYQKLQDGEQQILENEKLIADGEEQLKAAKNTLANGEATLKQAREEYEKTRESMFAPLEQGVNMLLSRRQTVLSQIDAYNTQIQAIDGKLAELGGSGTQDLSQINAQIAMLDGQIIAADAAIWTAQNTLELLKQYPDIDPTLIEQTQRNLQRIAEQKETLITQRDTLIEERDALEHEGAAPEVDALESERNRLVSQRLTLEMSLQGIEYGLQEIENAIKLLDEQFAPAEEELAAGEEQIKNGRAQAYKSEKELADGRLELEKARVDLENGWKEYHAGKAEAEQELSNAERELADAKIKLSDAKETIDEMTDVQIFILDRNSNIGYGSLDSASDIVQGVSRVFPAFFLLVAALVCITTMTRMIDEERTQIGTLKALGYSNGAIISKYLLYAGSGAVIGCGLGVFVGSAAFPSILWQAYKIMLYITDEIKLRVNWWLCLAVVTAYTIVMLSVTWYCCRRALEEQPAELIRPRAPEAGKKILMEYLPFWHKISFLNKVTIRNIFRYRQRLAMMMVGIGGCTALLVTGFGLRDSIVNVVDYQFHEVTLYDLQAYFDEGQTEQQQEAFLQKTKDKTRNVLFYHQESIELEYDDRTKEIYLMAADEHIQDLIHFHAGDTMLEMPGLNHVLLSVGVAEAMGIDVGDSVTMRNSDMQILKLTVSGIYDNHVYNYAIVLPKTIESQWNSPVPEQMAMIQTAQEQDVHELSAFISDMNDVMNVSISEDLADMVGSMMKALDLVVIVIVFCAGLLAAIVLYNLTNININERMREIATIKVLGFRSSETAAYVFKENLSLTVVGSAVGLGLGYLLLIFVMSQIKIDMVWFKAMVAPMSYVWSIVLTIFAAGAVDFIFYFKLEKVNMAEALKSVE